jgi:hypothetical protein
MRKIMAALAVVVSIAAAVPTLANAAVANSADSSTYNAAAGAGGR